MSFLRWFPRLSSLPTSNSLILVLLFDGVISSGMLYVWCWWPIRYQWVLFVERRCIKLRWRRGWLDLLAMVVNLHRDRYHHSIPLLEKRELGTITNAMCWLSTFVTSILFLVKAIVGGMISAIADEARVVPLDIRLSMFLSVSDVLSTMLVFPRSMIRGEPWFRLPWLVMMMCRLEWLPLIFVWLCFELDCCCR